MYRTNLLDHVFTQKDIPKSGQNKSFSYSWWGNGILYVVPNEKKYTFSIAISVGIHGNETAPIELLSTLLTDLFQEKVALNVRLLIIFGNLDAIQKEKRYVDYDLNRMFCGKYRLLSQNNETKRAHELEQSLLHFFKEAKPLTRYHYDLHTAIRESKFPTFALLPVYYNNNDSLLYEQLNAANLDAVVFHTAIGSTFTHFSSEYCGAQSVTLELGKAKPFGSNNLSEFRDIDRVLRNIITQSPLTMRTKKPLEKFTVIESIIKNNEDFKINLDVNAENFSEFKKGDIIASLSPNKFLIADQTSWILFPNPNVALGLRAGLLLKQKFN